MIKRTRTRLASQQWNQEISLDAKCAENETAPDRRSEYISLFAATESFSLT